MRSSLALVVALCACGKGERDREAPAPAPRPAGTLGAVAEVRGDASLIAGTRRFALRAGDRWYAPATDGVLALDRPMGAAIAKTLAELGGELGDVYFGATPIVVGGEEHREQHVRIAPAPARIELDGLLTQVAATRSGKEVWRYEHALRTGLAIVDGVDVRVGPPLELRTPPVPGVSPVSAKLCAKPRIKDLASDGRDVVVLVTECNPEAPTIITTYTALGTPIAMRDWVIGAEALALGAEHLALGRPALETVVAGYRNGRLALARVRDAGNVATSVGPAVTNILELVVDDAGTPWTLAIAVADDGRERWMIVRDTTIVDLTAPDGTPVRPEALALDDKLGVVVLARGGASRWLLAERPPATPPLVIAGR